VTVNTEVFCSV